MQKSEQRVEASRENSCRVWPYFIRLQRSLHMQLQAELTPNHKAAPKHNSIGNRFQGSEARCCGLLEKKWLQSSNPASEFPRVPDLGKRRDP